MSLLTVDEFRAFLDDQVSLDDDTLQVMLDANEAAINRRAGDPAGTAETVYARGLTVLPLKAEPDTGEEITVTDYWSLWTSSTGTELTTDDYRVRGNALERTNGRTWGQRTSVTYTPVDRTAERKVVLVELMKSDLNHEPGMAAQGAGPWQESYTADHLAERERILDRLQPPPLFA